MNYEDQSDPTRNRSFGRLRGKFFRDTTDDDAWQAETERQRADIARAVAAELRNAAAMREVAR